MVLDDFEIILLGWTLLIFTFVEVLLSQEEFSVNIIRNRSRDLVLILFDFFINNSLVVLYPTVLKNDKYR